MVAHRRLALTELITKRTDVPFSFRKDKDYLKPRRVADVLEKRGSPAGLLEALVGTLDRS